jgi:hypothetical protein
VLGQQQREVVVCEMRWQRGMARRYFSRVSGDKNASRERAHGGTSERRGNSASGRSAGVSALAWGNLAQSGIARGHCLNEAWARYRDRATHRARGRSMVVACGRRRHGPSGWCSGAHVMGRLFGGPRAKSGQSGLGSVRCGAGLHCGCRAILLTRSGRSKQIPNKPRIFQLAFKCFKLENTNT